MLVLLSRVSSAKLSSVAGHTAAIKKGLVLLVGVAPTDGEEQVDMLVKKILNMRIFSDETGKMNLSLTNIAGQLLLVSQFTLFGSVNKGTRPSFSKAANPQYAKQVYSLLVDKFRSLLNNNLQTGDFGKHMNIEVVMDGPVTLNFEV